MGRRRQFLGGGAASAPPCKVHTVSYIFMEREDYLTGRGVYIVAGRVRPQLKDMSANSAAVVSRCVRWGDYTHAALCKMTYP